MKPPRAARAPPRLDTAASEEIEERDEVAAMREEVAEPALNALRSLDHGESAAVELRLETLRPRALPTLEREIAERLLMALSEDRSVREADWLR